MTKHNKNGIQYTVEQLQQLVQKICYSKQISLYHHKYGPKFYTQHQFVSLLVLYARSNKSLRRFVQELYESKWPEWLNLREIPCKSSIHNHFQRIGLSIVRSLNKLAVKDEKAITMAIDSTGLDANRASKHYEKRIMREYRPYLKLSILGQSTKPYLIHDFVCGISRIADVRQAKPLIHRLKKGKIVFADKAYDCNYMMEMCHEKGSKLYCPIRGMTHQKVRGRFRKKLKKEFDKDFYHKGRNPIEMMMFLIKSFGMTIRAKKLNNQIKEVAWKLLAFNIHRLAQSYLRLVRLICLWTRPALKALCIKYKNVLWGTVHTP